VVIATSLCIRPYCISLSFGNSGRFRDSSLLVYSSQRLLSILLFQKRIDCDSVCKSVCIAAYPLRKRLAKRVRFKQCRHLDDDFGKVFKETCTPSNKALVKCSNEGTFTLRLSERVSFCVMRGRIECDDLF
jgi:hypothetical protein